MSTGPHEYLKAVKGLQTLRNQINSDLVTRDRLAAEVLGCIGIKLNTSSLKPQVLSDLAEIMKFAKMEVADELEKLPAAKKELPTAKAALEAANAKFETAKADLAAAEEAKSGSENVSSLQEKVKSLEEKVKSSEKDYNSVKEFVDNSDERQILHNAFKRDLCAYLLRDALANDDKPTPESPLRHFVSDSESRDDNKLSAYCQKLKNYLKNEVSYPSWTPGQLERSRSSSVAPVRVES